MKRAVLTALSLAALAVPAAAARAGSVLVAGPVKVHAYRMYMIASPAVKHSRAKLLILFERGDSRHVQDHLFAFSRRVSVGIAADGHAASLSADLLSYGHLKLRFSLGGPRVTLPGRCGTTSVGQHFGTLAAPSGLVLNTHFSPLGTVRRSSVGAYITTVRGTLTCTPQRSNAAKGVTRLSAVTPVLSGGVASFDVSHSARGFIAEDVLVVDRASSPSGPSITHAIDETALPQSDFSFAADFATARERGASPFLTGGLAFGHGVRSGRHLVTGTATGSLTAHFDGLGLVRAVSGGTFSSLSH